jgi:hypothetical protein
VLEASYKPTVTGLLASTSPVSSPGLAGVEVGVGVPVSTGVEVEVGVGDPAGPVVSVTGFGRCRGRCG